MDIEKVLYSYMKQYPMATKILKEVQQCGDTYLFGGCLRAYNDEEVDFSPRDIDIVVDTNDNEHYLQAILLPYYPIKNRFGGYKLKFKVLDTRVKYYKDSNFEYSELSIDIWSLQNTWAFANHLLPYSKEEYGEHLQDTVFLNIDSIAYNVTKDILYDERYQMAMKTKILDVVLKENPELELNLLRTLILKKRYNMVLSAHLKQIIYNYVTMIDYNLLINKLMNLQKKRYHNIILNNSELRNELNSLDSL